MIKEFTFQQAAFPNSSTYKSINNNNKKNHPSGYKPISILPIIFENIRRIVHDQINSFVSENNILYNFQIWIQNKQSTYFCFPCLTNQITKGYNEGLLTRMILIELFVHKSFCCKTLKQPNSQNKAFSSLRANTLKRNIKKSLILEVFLLKLSKAPFQDQFYF